MTILIVEDDEELNQMLQELLKKEGYAVEKAYSGTEALLLLEKRSFSLILLDLMLPGKTGEQVLCEVKKNNHLPVIVISAKAEIESKVSLIKNGADDYMTKPFDHKELLARIEAVLRRIGVKNESGKEIYYYKDIVLDTRNILVKVSDQEIVLTRYEFYILQLLMSEPKRIFTKNIIYESIWNEAFDSEENAINVHISNIRKKLAKVSPGTEYIQTVRGLGFRLA